MVRAASAYCAQVNKCLACPASMKRPFLRQLKKEIDFYCEDHGKQDVQALYAAFGTPESVAEEFLRELSAKTVAKCKGTQKRVLIATVIVVLIAATAAGVLGLQSYAMKQKIDEDGFVASVIYKEEAESNPFWISFQEDIFGHTDKVE